MTDMSAWNVVFRGRNLQRSLVGWRPNARCNTTCQFSPLGNQGYMTASLGKLSEKMPIAIHAGNSSGKCTCRLAFLWRMGLQ
jgi:hypothetical protein